MTMGRLIPAMEFMRALPSAYLGSFSGIQRKHFQRTCPLQRLPRRSALGRATAYKPAAPRVTSALGMPYQYAISDDMRQILEGQSQEMCSDKFWRDLATGINVGLRNLKNEADAYDSVSAKEYRKQAIIAFEEGLVELEKAQVMKMWVAAFETVGKVIPLLKNTPAAQPLGSSTAAAPVAPLSAPPTATPTAPPIAPRVTAASTLQGSMEVAKAIASGNAPAGVTADGKPAFECDRANPFKWDQDDDGSVSVSIPVPADASKGDVKVVFGTQHLKVAVKGHPMDPIIDSKLLYTVNADECGWTFESSGAKRMLVVTLEKKQSEQQWASLLDDAEGQKKKMMTDLAQGIEGMGPLKAYGT